MGIIFSILCFFLLDTIWIKAVMLPLYQSALSSILLSDIKMLPAVLAYILLIFSLWYLVINPHRMSDNLTILKHGAIVGICLYGTYALTCWTLFEGFHAKLVFLDILWGGFLYASTALATVKFLQWNS